ncbi:hypothetical protein Mal15_40920 [Stieleria maiorica]|uniref:Uncharacterized protein n=1 Tax=Stieleria maiorica TaxID=2795974 RepID=A0A5B9MGM5_9BACT|nr:hypothetical protein Mal15_40920 [Stieleria maiorica]
MGGEWDCPSGALSSFYDPATRVDYALSPPPDGECGKYDDEPDWNFETTCIMLTECKDCDPYNKCKSDFSTSYMTYPMPNLNLIGDVCGDCD